MFKPSILIPTAFIVCIAVLSVPYILSGEPPIDGVIYVNGNVPDEFKEDYGYFKKGEQGYTCADGVLYKWFPDDLNERHLGSYEIVGEDAQCKLLQPQ